MFARAIIVIGALGLLAIANPVAPAPGVRIVLQNNAENGGALNDEDIKRHQVRVFNKYQRNLRTTLNNTGRLIDGAELREFRSVPRALDKRTTSSVPLTFHTMEYTGAISIGTPPQPFTVLFDTGTADTWVVGAGCMTSVGCKDKLHKYTKSSTGVAKIGVFDDEFGDGLEASGMVFTDNVNVAGLTSKKQFFGAVTTVSDQYAQEPEEGTVGLSALAALSNIPNSVPFVLNVGESLDHRQFAFKFTDTAGELTIGGVDTSAYTGAIELHDNFMGLWAINGASILVNGAARITNIDTIIDTGTHLIVGPPSEVQTFYAAIPNSQLFNAVDGTYSFPCNGLPTIGFKWGTAGKTWTFSSASFIARTLDNGMCLGAIVGLDTGGGPGVWLVGTRFLKSVYTVFDFEQSQIGFATLA